MLKLFLREFVNNSGKNSYLLPSRNTIKKKVSDYAEEEKTKLIHRLESIQKVVAVSKDLWISLIGIPILGIKFSYIKDFVLFTETQELY